MRVRRVATVSLPLLFASLTGRSGHGLAPHLACSHIDRSLPLGLYPCSERPVSDSTVSPNSSLMVGWGCIRPATSAAVASQFTAR